MPAKREENLADLIEVDDIDDCRVHLAVQDPTVQRADIHPVDIFVNNPKERKAWNEWPLKSDRFKGNYIALFARYGPKPKDEWLFYGVSKVKGRPTGKDGKIHYKVEETDRGEDLIGKLVVRYHLKGMSNRFTLRTLIRDKTRVYTLPKPYRGMKFPGLNGIDITFSTLRAIYSYPPPEWESRLRMTGGVYLVTNVLANKRYVGVAYGANGIWKRWGEYVDSGGSGYSKKLKEILSGMKKEDRESFAESNLKFALLESWPFRSKTQSEATDRENHWKRVLLSRGPSGYNDN